MAQYKKVAQQKSGISTKIYKKSLDLLRFIQSRPEGVRIEDLTKNFNIPRRTLYNRLNKLKQHGFIENRYPLWGSAKNLAESQEMAQLLNGTKKIQAHKFSFTLKLIKKPDWWEKRDNSLIKLNEFRFKSIKFGKNPYYQIGNENFYIQTFANSIVFINRKQYWASDSYGAFLEALEDTLDMLSYFENKVKFKFYGEEIPQFSVKSMHFVKLKDSIAENCKKSGKGFEIEINGKLRGWVDMSEPLGMEFGHKNYAVEDTKKYTKFVEDIIENNPPTISELNQEMIKLTKINQDTALGLSTLVEFVKHQQLSNKMLIDNNIDVKKGVPSYIN